MHNPADPEYSTVSGRAGYAQAAAEIAGKLRTELVIFSQALDPALYGSEAFIEPLKNFLLSSHQARVRGLVRSPQAAMRSSNRLIELAKRLSSRIEFRELPAERQDLEEEYLVGNQRIILHRGHPEQLEARYYLDAPLLGRERLKDFEAIWQEATVAREFTDLKI